MTKRAVDRTESNDLRAVLDTKPDYSPAFTARVASLTHHIERSLSVPVKHDPDMNYSSAQKMVICLTSAYQPVPFQDDRAKYRLSVYVSSKALYFAVVIFKLSASTASWQKVGLARPSQYWIQVAGHELSARLKGFRGRVISIMTSQHYRLLQGAILSQELAGRLTGLGQPATVFDVLFSEVY
jgi:hypothetical protein